MGNQSVSREKMLRAASIWYGTGRQVYSKDEDYSIHVAIQLLIEGIDTKDNEPGETHKIPEKPDQRRSPAEDKANAGTPGPTMTDDEALGRMVTAMSLAYFTTKRIDGVEKAASNHEGYHAALAHLRRRLQDATMYERKWSDLIETTSTRTDQNKPKRVTREQIIILLDGWLGYPREKQQDDIEAVEHWLRELGIAVDDPN